MVSILGKQQTAYASKTQRKEKKITVAGNKWYKIERVGYSVPKSRENWAIYVFPPAFFLKILSTISLLSANTTTQRSPQL